MADRVMLVRATFSRVRDELDALGVARVDGLVADLGVSSPQLDDAERGMSFRREGPHRHAHGPRRAARRRSSSSIASSDDELADVIYQYGEERRSRRIARSIKKALAAERAARRRSTCAARSCAPSGPARVGGVDPATRTFQALRIAVNRELEELDALLASLPDVVAEGGVAAIIRFHSLEDRLVKRAFHADGWEPLTKKPLVASDEEQHAEPARAQREAARGPARRRRRGAHR